MNHHWLPWAGRTDVVGGYGHQWLDRGGAGMRVRGTAEDALQSLRGSACLECVRPPTEVGELYWYPAGPGAACQQLSASMRVRPFDPTGPDIHARCSQSSFLVTYIRYSMPRTRAWVKREDIGLLLQLELAIRGHVTPRLGQCATLWARAIYREGRLVSTAVCFVVTVIASTYDE